MRKLAYLASAQRDFVDILDFITRQSGNLAVGRHFMKALRQHCKKLASLPGMMGQARPELRPDIRSVAFRGYVIFFRYEDNRFEVVNVLEGHRDIPGYFNGD
jgi:plasmid stabilization system protein ParE